MSSLLDHLPLIVGHNLFVCRYFEGKRPWGVVCDVALPSATQNEIEKLDAGCLVNNGCKYVFEGANMPSDNDAIEIFKKNKVVYFPAKVIVTYKICFYFVVLKVTNVTNMKHFNCHCLQIESKQVLAHQICLKQSF